MILHRDCRLKGLFEEPLRGLFSTLDYMQTSATIVCRRALMRDEHDTQGRARKSHDVVGRIGATREVEFPIRWIKRPAHRDHELVPFNRNGFNADLCARG